MNRKKPNSVEEYLASLDPVKAGTLRSVINFILRQFPELESRISWNVPQIHRNGEYVFGVNAFKRHLTLAPWSPRVMAGFKMRLKKFVVKQHTFQVPVDWKIDGKLLKDLVRARLAELERKPSRLPGRVPSTNLKRSNS
jgi:uncharacterized protein YdhG (YjbR/CyaY superfamily)